MDLSARQQAILEYIHTCTEENGYPPSIREIGSNVGISSTSVVNYNLDILERKDYIEREREISRGLRLTDRAEALFPDEEEATFAIPLVGVIVAGEPAPVPDSDFPAFDEMIAVTQDIIPRSRADRMYALRVNGESMIDALINDGDIVVVEHQQEARNGDMVAAWLTEEKETTLKYFFHEEENHRVRLQPANPAYEPIYVQPANLQIQGKVVAVLRQVE